MVGCDHKLVSHTAIMCCFPQANWVANRFYVLLFTLTFEATGFNNNDFALHERGLKVWMRRRMA